jgi:hypothetical protein
LSIFKWRQGSYDLLEFIHTVLMRNKPGFWRIVSYQYRAPAESLEFITVTPLHPSIFSPLGANHYNLVRIKPDTEEYVLYEEYANGIDGVEEQKSLGMLTLTLLETFLRILHEARLKGNLSAYAYAAWFTDPSFFLGVRRRFALSVEEIVKGTKDENIDNAIDIFRLCRGDHTILYFINTLPHDPDAFCSYWRHTVDEYYSNVNQISSLTDENQTRVYDGSDLEHKNKKVKLTIEEADNENFDFDDFMKTHWDEGERQTSVRASGMQHRTDSDEPV